MVPENPLALFEGPPGAIDLNQHAVRANSIILPAATVELHEAVNGRIAILDGLSVVGVQGDQVAPSRLHMFHMLGRRFHGGKSRKSKWRGFPVVSIRINR
jgi:hypothetical protein